MTKQEIETLRSALEEQLSTRAIETLPQSYNPEKHSMRVIAASEKPTPMIDWERWMVVDEILKMDGMELPQGRAQVPLLDSHNRFSIESILGTAREFQTLNDQKEGTIYFSSTDRAKTAEQLARDGHLTDLSVGYRALESFFIPESEKQIIGGKEYAGPLRVTTKWQLKELSLVPIGADENAVTKSIRSNNAVMEQLQKIGMPVNASERELLTYMKRLFESTPPEQIGEAPVTITTKGEHNMDKATKTAEEIAAERNANETEIRAIGAAFENRIAGGKAVMDRIVKDAIDCQTTPELFRGTVYRKITDSDPLEIPDSALGLSKKEVKNYSVMRAIRGILKNENDVDATFERECSNEIAKKLGPPQGFYVPYEVQRAELNITPAQERVVRTILQRAGISQRDLNITTSTAGGNLVGTDLMAASYEDLLRAKLLAFQLGIQMLPGLRGNVTIPRATGDPTAYWIATEGDPTTESQPTFGQAALAPKTVGAWVDITRELMLQSTPAVDGIVLNAVAQVIARKFNTALFDGAAASGEPRGLINVSGIGTVDGTDFNWESAVEFETDVAEANADDYGPLAFVMRPSVRGTLKTRLKGSNTSGIYLVTGNEMNGYPVLVTTGMSTLKIGFGAFNSIVMGLWGVLDIAISKEALLTSGGTRIVGFQTGDYAYVQPGALSICTTFS